MTADLSPVTATLPGLLAEIFPQSRPETRSLLSSVATVRTYRAGEAILDQGQETTLALVLDGYVALRRTTAEGRQLLVRIVKRGKLSPMLPLAALPSGSEVVALTDTPVALWRGDEVRSLAESDACLAVALMDQVLDALDEVATRLEGMLHQDALRRVARVLYEHVDLFFADVPVLTRTHLPMLVGTSREMTGRVIRALEARGIVARVGRQGFRLLDPAALARAAQPRDGRPRPGDRVGR